MGFRDVAARVGLVGGEHGRGKLSLNAETRRNDLAPDENQGHQGELSVVALGQSPQDLRLPGGPVDGSVGPRFRVGHGLHQLGALHQQAVQTIVDDVDALAHFHERLRGLSHDGRVEPRA